MSWLQTFLVVLIALTWAGISGYLVLTNSPSASAVMGLMTPPLMFVLGAAFGIPLKRISDALKNGGSDER